MATRRWLGSDGDWAMPDNWKDGLVPDAASDAVIDAVGSYAVAITSAVSAASLTLNAPDAGVDLSGSLSLAAGGVLTVKAGKFRLRGGTVIGGILSAPGGSFDWGTGGTLSGIQYDGTLALPFGVLAIRGGITLHTTDGTGDGAISVGSDGNFATLLFDNLQTIDHATIALGTSAGYAASITMEDVDGSADDVLTFGRSLTINSAGAPDGSGYFNEIGADRYQTGKRARRIVNQGAINALSGTLAIDPGSFANTGSITVSAGAALDAAGLPDGIDNAGGTIRFAAGSNPLRYGTKIVGGTIIDAGAAFVISGGTLSGVTYDGTLALTSGYLDIADGIKLQGVDGTGDGSISIGAAAGSFAALSLDDTQTLDHGTVTLGGSEGYGAALTGADTDGSGDDVITLGPALTINATRSTGYDYGNHLGYDVFQTGLRAHRIVNNGTINALAGVLTIDPQSFANQGTIAIAEGASLDTRTESNSIGNAGGTIRFAAGSDPLENGAKIYGGTIVDAGAAFQISGGTLSGVTYDGTLTLASGYIEVADGIALNKIDGISGGSATVGSVGSYATLLFDDSQTIDQGTVALALQLHV